MSVQESNLNKRISGTDINGISCNGVVICDPIAVDLTESCPVKFVGFKSAFEIYETANFGLSKVILLDADKGFLYNKYIGSEDGVNIWGVTSDGETYTGDLATILSKDGAPDASEVTYVIFTPDINNASAAITMTDLAGMEILMP